jgi:hypothetical protein
VGVGEGAIVGSGEGVGGANVGVGVEEGVAAGQLIAGRLQEDKANTSIRNAAKRAFMDSL